MRTSIIAAMGRNAIIGTETGLPWHLPKDLRRFRELTLGKPVILGRKTLELIGHPLPGRSNVVLTRNPDYRLEGVLVAHDVPEALRLAEQEATRLGASESMVIGGGEVYRLLFPFVDRLYLTFVADQFSGTATFPVELLRPTDFTVTDQATYPPDAKNPYAHDYVVLERTEGGVRPPASVLHTLLDVA